MKSYEKPIITDDEFELLDIIAISSDIDGASVDGKSIGEIDWK